MITTEGSHCSISQLLIRQRKNMLEMDVVSEKGEDCVAFRGEWRCERCFTIVVD